VGLVSLGADRVQDFLVSLSLAALSYAAVLAVALIVAGRQHPRLVVTAVQPYAVVAAVVVDVYRQQTLNALVVPVAVLREQVLRPVVVRVAAAAQRAEPRPRTQASPAPVAVAAAAATPVAVTVESVRSTAVGAAAVERPSTGSPVVLVATVRSAS
jgi:hypothetical protein